MNVATCTKIVMMISFLSVTVSGSTQDWIDYAPGSEGGRLQLGRVEQIEVRGTLTRDDGSKDSFRAICRVENVSKKDVFRRKLSIPNYVFGYGTTDSKQETVRLLTHVTLEVGSRMMAVPAEGLGDLARPEIAKLLFVFSKHNQVILEIGGPDGSEGYEAQFVSDGSKFLYRTVRYESSPSLENHPNPLRTNF